MSDSPYVVEMGDDPANRISVGDTIAVPGPGGGTYVGRVTDIQPTGDAPGEPDGWGDGRFALTIDLAPDTTHGDWYVIRPDDGAGR